MVVPYIISVGIFMMVADMEEFNNACRRGRVRGHSVMISRVLR